MPARQPPPSVRAVSVEHGQGRGGSTGRAVREVLASGGRTLAQGAVLAAGTQNRLICAAPPTVGRVGAGEQNWAATRADSIIGR
jgi:hypothetical protein